MEGGILSWKIQKIENNSPQLDAFKKPLPPPPHGYIWIKLEDSSWELQHRDDINSDDNVIVLDKHSIIHHTVMPSDTLIGICLQYNVSATVIRRMNMFSGNNIQAIKTLRIPVDPGVPIIFQRDSEDVLIQKFHNLTGEGFVESKFYLAEAGWDVNKAIGMYNGDDEWIAKYSRQSNLAPLSADIDVVPVVEAANIEEVNIVSPVDISFNRPSTGIELTAFDMNSSLQPLLSHEV